MTDNPTREAVQQSLDYVAGQYSDSGQHMSRDMEDIFAAAHLWLGLRQETSRFHKTGALKTWERWVSDWVEVADG